ncbi:MAG: HAD family hydrolase [Spirochaetaceae bacterium]|nr:HAD family hydrolase [Spirochaetaceae bacterium]
MTIYKIPKDLKTIIFDIDSTLYTNNEYAREQVDIQIRHFAKLNNKTFEEAKNLITEYKNTWKKKHNGQNISLGNTLQAFGVTIQESIRWRENLLKPELFLSKDEKLRNVLLELKKNYKLICVTNNPVLPGTKTLKALGIDDLFEKVIGLDTCGVSKPHKKPFILGATITSTPIEKCISIGDRYDIDIALPLELGMGGILVQGVEDVYRLSKILEVS